MDSSLWKKYGYLILVIYLVLGFFVIPALGIIALVCMVAPVVMAFYSGREWCGKYCPRGSLWDSVLTKLNSGKEIPAWARTKYFRTIMVLLIFTLFGWQMAFAWPNPAEIGLVFLRIIFITTLVGMGLAITYSPRTWCSFCPMGSLAALVSAGKKPIAIEDSCINCGICARNCPMQLEPYKGQARVFSHVDCLKCDACITACPKGALQYIKGATNDV